MEQMNQQEFDRRRFLAGAGAATFTAGLSLAAGEEDGSKGQSPSAEELDRAAAAPVLKQDGLS